MSFDTVEAIPPPPAIKLSEVYGGGGNAGATLTNDFIELYNRTGAPISLAGWSVQYASAAGHDLAGHAATGSIPAGGTTSSRRRPAPAARAAADARRDRHDRDGGHRRQGRARPTTTAAHAAPARPARRSSTSSATARPPTASRARPGAGPHQHHRRPAQGRRRHRHRQQRRRLHGRRARTAHRRRPGADGRLDARPANGATDVALDANVVDHVQRAGQRDRRLVHDLLRDERAHVATRERRPDDVHARPGRELRGRRRCTVTVIAANVTDQDAVDPPDTMAANFTFRFSAVDACVHTFTPIHDIQGSARRPRSPATSRRRASSSATSRAAPRDLGLLHPGRRRRRRSGHLRRHLRLHRRRQRKHGQRGRHRPRHRLRPRAVQPDDDQRRQRQQRGGPGGRHRPLRHGPRRADRRHDAVRATDLPGTLRGHAGHASRSRS